MLAKRFQLKSLASNFVTFVVACGMLSVMETFHRDDRPEMTEQERQQLSKQWDELDDKRLELWNRHDPVGKTYFEDESWHGDYVAIEQQQDALFERIEAFEELEMSSLREFNLDDIYQGSPDFPWDHWQRWAAEDGVSKELAELGRTVVREAYLHNWPEELKCECGWQDDGEEMIRLAQEQPDRARIRWKYLLDSDGDFHWRK